MNAVRLTAMQRYYLEALGRQGRLHLGPSWADVEERLAYCWYASGFADGIEWFQVRDIVKRSGWACALAQSVPAARIRSPDRMSLPHDGAARHARSR
ncbi:hypothetical protein [Lysobacter arvi]|uniref:Uncharacterized protein n=1 Tax=Lysobacter arvi TaxID=3038776 RepID=A0ABU1C9M3_9GAMM|nr:hypothetical protein [Lysobacter arvi]MDR0181891.1 hypothetical protein [Lysobacter arvi]